MWPRSGIDRPQTHTTKSLIKTTCRQSPDPGGSIFQIRAYKTTRANAPGTRSRVRRPSKLRDVKPDSACASKQLFRSSPLRSRLTCNRGFDATTSGNNLSFGAPPLLLEATFCEHPFMKRPSSKRPTSRKCLPKPLASRQPPYPGRVPCTPLPKLIRIAHSGTGAGWPGRLYGLGGCMLSGPTFWKGCSRRQGRLEPKSRRFPAGPKTMYQKPGRREQTADS